MGSTKEMERKALDQIEKIILSLGEIDETYIGIAFNGCIEIARSNIENDEFCSMKNCWTSAQEVADLTKRMLAKSESDVDRLEQEVERLKKVIEREEEWRAYEDADAYSDAEYYKLRKTSDVKWLSDEEAVQLVNRECGFDGTKVRICHEKTLYEINRHNALRRCGVKERKPLYDATDWNYVRFECCGYVYELQNGSLRRVME